MQDSMTQAACHVILLVRDNVVRLAGIVVEQMQASLERWGPVVLRSEGMDRVAERCLVW